MLPTPSTGDEPPSPGLSASLARAGFALGRLKTGTPARLDGDTIDFKTDARLEKVFGDDQPKPFSFLNDRVTISPEEQVSCWSTRTRPETHDLIVRLSIFCPT